MGVRVCVRFRDGQKGTYMRVDSPYAEYVAARQICEPVAARGVVK
jgi:hypothetical protein